MATVKEIMTTDVVALDVELSLREGLEVLRAENVSGAPVVSGNSVAGVVSATDILEFAATTPGVPTGRPGQTEWGEYDQAEVWEEGSDSPSSYFADYWADAGAQITARFEESGSPEWDILADRSVSDVMTRRVVAVTPDADVRDAAAVMIEAGVHRVLVMNGRELLGILSATDVVRAVAESKL